MTTTSTMAAPGPVFHTLAVHVPPVKSLVLLSAFVLVMSLVRASPARAAPSDFVYAALGDSTGVGVGAREGGYVAHLYDDLLALRPRAQLANLCRSGATSAGVLESQVRRLPSSGVALVTIGVGINDLRHDVPVATFADRLDQIVRQVQARSSAQIVISNLPDVSLAPVVPLPLRPFASARVVAFNEAITRVAARHRLHVVDMYGASQREIPSHPEFFSDDGYHPSDSGYRFWASLMWPPIRALLAVPVGRG
jgi:acyl-CoA thioesterase-1